MKDKAWISVLIAGACAGAVNGLFGAGGGMVLVPMLGLLGVRDNRGIFSSSVAIILPICLVTLTILARTGGISWKEALPYLPGSAIGGWLAAKYGGKIPETWLHRGLGAFILWGGIRYLC